MKRKVLFIILDFIQLGFTLVHNQIGQTTRRPFFIFDFHFIRLPDVNFLCVFFIGRSHFTFGLYGYHMGLDILF